MGQANCIKFAFVFQSFQYHHRFLLDEPHNSWGQSDVLSRCLRGSSGGKLFVHIIQSIPVCIWWYMCCSENTQTFAQLHFKGKCWGMQRTIHVITILTPKTYSVFPEISLVGII